MRLKRSYWMIVFGLCLLLVTEFLVWKYVSQDESRLLALDTRTGQVQWSAPLEAAHAYPPTASHGMVFAVSKLTDPTTLSAFDAVTGLLLWEYAIDLQQFEWVDASIFNPPMASEEWVAAGINEQTLALLNAKSGVLQWCITGVENPADTQSFLLTNDCLFALSREGSGEDAHMILLALEAKTGMQMWKTTLGRAGHYQICLDQPAMTANEQLVFISGYYAVEAFDIQTGTLEFDIETSSRQLQAIGDTLYINTSESLMAVDAATGVSRWTFLPPASNVQPDLFGMQTVGEVTYIANDGREEKGVWLFALNAADGHELWRSQLVETSGSFLYSVYSSPVANREAFFMTLPVGEHDPFLLSLDSGSAEAENDLLTAFSAVDGTELWQFSIDQREHFVAAPTLQDDLVFVTDRAPRWRNWLTSLNRAGPD